MRLRRTSKTEEVRALYERLIDAERRIADIQAEEIATLRAQLGLTAQALASVEVESVASHYKHPVSEDQEDLEWQFEAGQITEQEFDDALKALGIHNPILDS